MKKIKSFYLKKKLIDAQIPDFEMYIFSSEHLIGGVLAGNICCF